MTVSTPPNEPSSASAPRPAKPSFFGQIAADLRADLHHNRRPLALMAGLYVLGGAIAGICWALWAPREHYQTVEGGYTYVDLNAESQIGGDVVLLLILLTLTVALTVWSWFWGPRRGLVAMMATVLGSVIAGFVAWLFGVVVTSKPSPTDLNTPGTVFSVDQQLHSVATILVPAVLATLLYVVLAMFTGYDGLWRRAEIRKSDGTQGNAADGNAVPASGPTRPDDP